MRSAINDSFSERTESRNVVIETIDVADENINKLEPGRFILKRFASSEIYNGYREKSRVPIQDYIVQREVIKNRIIWVKGLASEDAAEWVAFCREFTPKNAMEGLFVVEVQGSFNLSETKNMRVFNYSECVSDFDVQLFNGFLLNDVNSYSDSWKRYISAVCTQLCGTDAEVSEALIMETDFRKEDPMDGIKRISREPHFARRGTENQPNHILYLYRNAHFAQIEHRVWSAQVQILFPIIELERTKIISELETDIQRVLDSKAIKQYGELLKEPMDVELGTLCYMLSCTTDDQEYLLHLPDTKIRNRIHFLHECRNMLAHTSCCSPEQIAELID